jgi:Rrf2 family nitric oxide-sensitive transcriptional repressor
MRLTTFTDFALRLLMLTGAAPGKLVTIDGAARAYGISRAHLMKVAQRLVAGGLLVSVRGRSGGLRLARPPADISLAEVVRLTEPDFALVECLTTHNQCAITGPCRLPRILGEATDAFLQTLEGYTLADILISFDGAPARRLRAGAGEIR